MPRPDRAMPPKAKVRPAVVEALFHATTSDQSSEEHVAELLWNATPEERQAVADMHWMYAEQMYAKGEALAYAMASLRRYWWSGKPQSGPRPFTLGDALKVCPPDVARDVLTRLYGAGFSEADGLPPRPVARGDS
jgi:hypothetical protein